MPSDFVACLRARCRAGGFTLVELMVTIVIAAVLATIAVPSFRNLIQSNRLTTSANAMVDALNTARMGAIKLNATTQFCSNSATSNTNSTPDPLGAACGTNAGAVYALPQGAATAGLVRATSLNLDSQIRLSGTIAAIRFSGRGFGYAATGTSDTPYNGGTVAVVCSTALSSNNRRVVSMNAGSIITTTTTTGSCP
ncbi:MAG: prepilin-type N-terminal cleavage/methylation domain-containing protein [Rhodanobacteraceae bacterium]|nr:MAG: prepilin-type N-terminal cleavage/methylation domain-containing protein [Rhodanobacteraceae bacterium]